MIETRATIINGRMVKMAQGDNFVIFVDGVPAIACLHETTFLSRSVGYPFRESDGHGITKAGNAAFNRWWKARYTKAEQEGTKDGQGWYRDQDWFDALFERPLSLAQGAHDGSDHFSAHNRVY